MPCVFLSITRSSFCCFLSNCYKVSPDLIYDIQWLWNYATFVIILQFSWMIVWKRKLSIFFLFNFFLGFIYIGPSYDLTTLHHNNFYYKHFKVKQHYRSLLYYNYYYYYYIIILNYKVTTLILIIFQAWFLRGHGRISYHRPQFPWLGIKHF